MPHSLNGYHTERSTSLKCCIWRAVTWQVLSWDAPVAKRLTVKLISAVRSVLTVSCTVRNVLLSVMRLSRFIGFRYVFRVQWIQGLVLIISQKWNGSFFVRTTLRSLGLRIQLGHSGGHKCVNPAPSSRDEFVIIDLNGIHHVNLDYCECQTAQARYTQLLRFRLFPATSTDPRTAATFRLLKNFQMLSFTSKASAFEYYQALTRLTDNIGNPVPVSSPQASVTHC